MKKEKTPIYCISGMAATSNLYERIDVGRPLHFIEWVEPEANESLKSYCERLCEQIKHDGPIILMGLSFGGLATMEIARQREVEKAILISSIKNDGEKPAFFRMLSRIPLYKIQNEKLRVKSLPLWGPLFGVEDEFDKKRCIENMSIFSDNYLAWSIAQLSNWESVPTEVETYHIHGDQDRIFPLKYIQDATVIKGGNHSMIMKKSNEISEHIKSILAISG